MPSRTTTANSPLSSADFSFELPPPPPANAGIDQNICGLTTNMAGNNPAPGTGLWTLVSGPGTATFVNPAVRNTSVTVTLAGVYIFQWTITDGSTGLSTSDQVQVSFSNPASASDAGPDQTVCGNQATMAGNTPTSGFGSWFSVSGPGTISFSNPSSPSCLVTASVDGTYILQWNIFNGVCPVTSDQVSITFNSQAPAPNAGFDDVICGLTYTLNGNDPSPSSGLWTLNSGPGSANFTNATQYNTSVSVSAPGVYLFDWTITNPVCPPEAISVQITFNFYPEVCNGIDDDCDSQIDEGVLTTYYVDADGDGFGDAAQFTQACTPPAGYVLDDTDCDDLNPAVYPGATEVCNLIDDNCNNQIDEGVETTFYQDLDGDTYGNPNAAVDACTEPAGYVANNFDCDDTDATIYTGAPETCNLLDDDCDNQIDEGVQNTYYADVDGDTFG
ncbi:MAG: MopE-related protein, partial [Bacteroidota bacterium]